MRPTVIIAGALIAGCLIAYLHRAAADTCADSCAAKYTACTNDCKASDTNCFTKCVNERESCLATCK